MRPSDGQRLRAPCAGDGRFARRFSPFAAPGACAGYPKPLEVGRRMMNAPSVPRLASARASVKPWRLAMTLPATRASRRLEDPTWPSRRSPSPASHPQPNPRSRRVIDHRTGWPRPTSLFGLTRRHWRHGPSQVPWMISTTSAFPGLTRPHRGHGPLQLRFAVHRLIGSSIVTLIATLLLVA